MKSRKLRTRIILWVMGLSLALSFALGAYNCYGDYTSAVEKVDELLSLSTGTNALALKNYIDGLKHEIMTLAYAGGLTSASLTYDERQANLNAVLRARPDISALYTIGTDGISLNDSDYTFEEASGEDYSGEEFFISAMAADGIWIDDPVFDEWTNNITLTITYRFSDGAGFDGVIGMDIHYDALMGIISQGSVGRTGYSVMVNGAGRMIAHPNEQYVLEEKNFMENPGAEAAFGGALTDILKNRGEGSKRDITLEGEDVLLYYHVLPDTGWALITIAKPHEFMDPFYSSLRATLIMLGVCVVAAALVALYIGNNIARPITRMTQRMLSFAQGDLHSPMPEVRARDEIGVLYQALTQSIQALARYVRDITQKLDQIAAGNVTETVDIEYSGDFAPIKETLNRILASLNDVMSSVKDSARGVKATTDQMSMAAEQLSQNTVHQAQTIDQLSSAFASIKGRIENTAANTTQALEKTSAAKSALEDSSGSMANMLSSMKEIDSAAASIGRIIKTIDDIAFQTNILALNAAVEAARAGQHGKGFAVVADEVRNLASKSAESASQTAQLIQNTLQAVGNGTKTAGDASGKIGGLVTLVEELAALVQLIEQDANSQAGEASNVYEGIAQLSSIVQNDSAMAQQTAAAGLEMRGRAEELYASLTFFTLKE